MERVNTLLSQQEMSTLGRAMDAYQNKLEEKMAELNQVQTHLKVNEGLMQEVRQEKDRIRRELSACHAILNKLRGINGGKE